MTGFRMDQPQEYDDPNATIATILEKVRETGNSFEFPPSKLKSGCGEPCMRVLDCLANAALAKLNIKYAFPEYANEENEEFDVEEAGLSGDDDDAVEWLGTPGGGRAHISKLSNYTDEKDVVDADLEEDDILDLDALGKRTSQLRRTSEGADAHGKDGSLSYAQLSGENRNTLACSSSSILESTIDPSVWLLEVERVLPRLRVTIRSEAKDWRVHLNQMRRHQTEIETCYKDAQSHLSRLREDLDRSISKLTSREKYLNTQLDPLLCTYRDVQDQLSEVKEKYRQASTGITVRSRALADVTDELDRVKLEMDERGSSMTDGSPVVRIKRAIQRLKAEMVAMDIRTGVLEHILLRAHLRAREDAQKPVFGRGVDQAADATEPIGYVY